MTATQSQIRDALAELTDYECRPNGAPGNPLALSVAGCRTIRTILQSALYTQPNCIPLCSTQGTTNERVSSGDDQSKVRKVDTQKPAGDAAAISFIDEMLLAFSDKDDYAFMNVEKARLVRIKAALTGDCGGGDHPPIEGLEAAINNSIMYPMVNDVGFQSEHDRRVVMQAARRYLALTADNAKRGE